MGSRESFVSELALRRFLDVEGGALTEMKSTCEVEAFYAFPAALYRVIFLIQ